MTRGVLSWSLTADLLLASGVLGWLRKTCFCGSGFEAHNQPRVGGRTGQYNGLDFIQGASEVLE
jgi:hypothetical protein